ncbi:MAG TPA: sigma-70 family RNA polymerase sigma factor [Vicinamibacterales bacterium]
MIYTKTSFPRVFGYEEMADGAEDRRTFVARTFEDCGRRLYRYALVILMDRQDAEDVVQHVFAGLLTSGRMPADVEVFLRAAVRNAAFSMLRRRRTRRDASDQILVPIAQECPAEERAALEHALRLLPAEQREVVHLHVYEGMTFQEIARSLDQSINTVSARYRYALKGMRKTLS